MPYMLKTAEDKIKMQIGSMLVDLIQTQTALEDAAQQLQALAEKGAEMKEAGNDGQE